MKVWHWCFCISAVLIAAWLGYASAAPHALVPESPVVRSKPAIPAAPGVIESPAKSPTPTTPTTATAPTAAPLPAAASPNKDALLRFAPAQVLAEMPKLLDGLTQRAQLKDARALSELADWAEYCDRGGWATGYRASNSELRPGDLADPAVLNYFRQLGRECRAWMARHPWVAAEDKRVRKEHSDRITGRAPRSERPEPRNLSEWLRQSAAQQGDFPSQVFSTTEKCEPPATYRPEDMNLWHRCRHQVSLEILTQALNIRDPRAIAVLPEIIGTRGGGFVIGPNSFLYLRRESAVGTGNGTEVLWTLAACQLGLNCGPTGQNLRMACAYGVCGYPHYRDFAADYLLAPYYWRMVEQRLPMLLALIQAGDVAGILGPPLVMPRL